MQCRQLSIDELLEFFVREKSTYPDLDEIELSHLGQYGSSDLKQSYTLTDIYAAFTGQDKIAGYCTVPSFEKTIASSLYISRQYRRQGYATLLLNHLKIKRLNCLTYNTAAIKLYESMDFKQISVSYPSIRFERTPTWPSHPSVNCLNTSNDGHRPNPPLPQ